MAFDMALQLKGIPGESQVKEFKGWIDILAWSWGCSQSGTAHMGGGGGAGKANFQDISGTKWVDKASPKLVEMLTLGAHIPEGKLVMRKVSGTKPIDYLTFELKHILVTSVSVGGSGGEDRLTENFTLSFRSFKQKYIEQKEDGTEGDKPEFFWDIAAGEAKF